MVRKDRPVAKLKVTPISNAENRPCVCPKCHRRFQKKNALSTHYNSHSIGSLPRPTVKLKKTISKTRILKEGRNQGQKANKRVRNIDKMKEGIRAYEDALQNGESAAKYRERTGVLKQKVKHWRDRVKE